ncbi:serine/threonine-protein kinase [Ornithinimicrobium flavum]|uniref:serine/threonine-protein kinase n=1 Tax=Ornithinimicrobium flavum TaxID=1288636 RepID=UPI0010703A35|nr:serine/threonine-protein kinase [Ornithinimicrobium flavum]
MKTDPLPQGGHPTAPVEVVVPRSLGGYELLDRVGEGGMGVVWRAQDRHGREVAVKVLRPHIAHDDSARERLRREVHTLARVHHPRVAAVVDADVDGSAPYIVTEFVPGPPLDRVVERDGPLRGEDLLRLGRGLAAALHAIHQVDIVHRDLKPGNVLMVRRDGALEPIVIDFGIAQVADDVRLTSTGLVMGTPGYLSPEVVEGGAVSEATDWWGWAATLAYAASGHPPFGRGPVTVVLDRVTRGRLQLEGVEERLRPLLAAALDPDPARRPDEHEVLDALERYARHEDVTSALTRVHGLVDPTRRAPQRPPAPPSGRPWAPPDQGSRQQDGQGPRTAYPERQFAQQPVQQGDPGAPGAPGALPAQADAGAPPAPGGLPAQGVPPAPDPRIGRSSRAGTLAALLVALVGVTSVVPLLGWGLYALWGLIARTVDRSLTGLVLRRYEVGPRRGDIPLAVLASPWHLLTAALSTVLSLLLPVAIGVIVPLVLSGLVTTTEVMAGVGPDHPLAVGAGALVGGWLGWWGLGSTSLRRGSRTLVRGSVPAGAATVVVTTLSLLGGAGLLAWAVLTGEHVSWWPLTPGSTPWDLLPFSWL